MIHSRLASEDGDFDLGFELPSEPALARDFLPFSSEILSLDLDLDFSEAFDSLDLDRFDSLRLIVFLVCFLEETLFFVEGERDEEDDLDDELDLLLYFPLLFSFLCLLDLERDLLLLLEPPLLCL